jgi:DNA-binding XRE family transcriptional regulator
MIALSRSIRFACQRHRTTYAKRTDHQVAPGGQGSREPAFEGGGGAGDEVGGVADVGSNVPACAGPAARQQGPGIGHDQPVVVGVDHASAGTYPLGDLVRIVYRKQPGTLDDLARRSGFSRRMLRNIEQGNANPSIATLLRISDALGTGLPGLVDADRPAALRLTPGKQALSGTCPGGRIPGPGERPWRGRSGSRCAARSRTCCRPGTAS